MQNRGVMGREFVPQTKVVQCPVRRNTGQRQTEHKYGISWN